MNSPKATKQQSSFKATSQKTSFWGLWANALGQKASRVKHEADRIAIIRTLIVLQAVVCNIFIVWNIIRNW